MRCQDFSWERFCFFWNEFAISLSNQLLTKLEKIFKNQNILRFFSLHHSAS